MVRRDLSLFTDAVRRHGLEHYFSDSTVTVFAPNNDAIRRYVTIVDLDGQQKSFLKFILLEATHKIIIIANVGKYLLSRLT